jgi:hypothetical protein
MYVDGMQHHFRWENGLIHDAVALEVELFDHWHGRGGR